MAWRLPKLFGSRVLCPSGSCSHFGRGVSSDTRGLRFCRKCRQGLPCDSACASDPLVITALGTERSGKTNWLIRGLCGMKEASESFTFPIDGQAERWDRHMAILDCGKAFSPTVAVPGVAWCVDLVKDGAAHRVYIHDTSGQEAHSGKLLLRHRSLCRANVLVLVLDPFGIPSVWKRYGKAVQTMRPPVRRALHPFDVRHLSALLRTLQTLRTAPRQNQWDIPLAVVLSKMDVLGLSRDFGDPETATRASVEKACREHLAGWGLENVMRILEARFSKVAYFACQPFGDPPFSPETSLLWALQAGRQRASKPDRGRIRDIL